MNKFKYPDLSYLIDKNIELYNLLYDFGQDLIKLSDGIIEIDIKTSTNKSYNNIENKIILNINKLLIFLIGHCENSDKLELFKIDYKINLDNNLNGVYNNYNNQYNFNNENELIELINNDIKYNEKWKNLLIKLIYKY